MPMVALASSFGTQQPSQPSVPPVPVAASFDVATAAWQIIFDKDVEPSSITQNGFQMVVGGSAFTAVDPIDVDGNVISGIASVGQPAPVSDRFNYVMGIGTWRGLNGLKIDNFTIVPSVGLPIPMSAVYDISQGVVDITMSEDVFINTAIKQDFMAVAFPNILTVQSIGIVEGNIIRLNVIVDGPGDLPSRVGYSGKVDGIEDGSGNDVPMFTIGLDVQP